VVKLHSVMSVLANLMFYSFTQSLETFQFLHPKRYLTNLCLPLRLPSLLLCPRTRPTRPRSLYQTVSMPPPPAAEVATKGKLRVVSQRLRRNGQRQTGVNIILAVCGKFNINFFDPGMFQCGPKMSTSSSTASSTASCASPPPSASDSTSPSALSSWTRTRRLASETPSRSSCSRAFSATTTSSCPPSRASRKTRITRDT
jgi:hypothetical protein